MMEEWQAGLWGVGLTIVLWTLCSRDAWTLDVRGMDWQAALELSL